MARASWFDEGSNRLLFTEYATKMASWQDAMADGVIDDVELSTQAERLQALLSALEPKLNDDIHQELTTIFYELAVFYGMVQVRDVSLMASEEQA